MNWKANQGSLIKYYGGKGGKDYIDMLKWLIKDNGIDTLADYTLYDIFGGGGHIACNFIGDCKKVVYNDLGLCIYCFFYCLKNEELREKLRELLCKTRVNFNTFTKARLVYSADNDMLSKYAETDEGKIKLAACAYIISQMSFNSNGVTYRMMKENKNDSDMNFMYTSNYLWKRYIDGLGDERIKDTMECMELHNETYQAILDGITADEKCIIIADPPYLDETRTSKGNYAVDGFTPDMHREMIDRLVKLGKPTIVCGYEEPEKENKRKSKDAEKETVYRGENAYIIKSGFKRLEVTNKLAATTKQEVVWYKF